MRPFPQDPAREPPEEWGTGGRRRSSIRFMALEAPADLPQFFPWRPMRFTTVWNRVKRPLEIILWMGVLGFVVYRFGPQVGAALGMGGEDTKVGGRGETIRTLDGATLSLEELDGKVVLVNVWATWCPPCVIEMPGFQKVYEAYRDQGFVILGLSRDQDPAQVLTFLQRKGITYPVAMSRDVDLGEISRVGTLPSSFLMGRDGRIKHRVEGLFAEPTLRMAVKKLLEDDGTPSSPIPRQ